MTGPISSASLPVAVPALALSLAWLEVRRRVSGSVEVSFNKAELPLVVDLLILRDMNGTDARINSLFLSSTSKVDQWKLKQRQLFLFCIYFVPPGS